MESIRTLAQQATLQLEDVSAGRLEYYLLRGLISLVEYSGESFRVEADTPLVIGQRLYALPSDWKTPIKVSLSYVPRAISTVSRVSGVLTVTTTLAHALAAGMAFQLVDVTSTEDFDGNLDVLAVTAPTPPATASTVFTATDTRDDDTGTGGTLEAVSGTVELTNKAASDLDLLPEAEATEGTPAYYYIPDTGTIGLEPVADGTNPAFRVEYWGGVPSTLDLTAAVTQIPSFLEDPLIEWAQARATGATLEQTRGILEMAAKDFRRWFSNAQRRNQQE